MVKSQRKHGGEINSKTNRKESPAHSCLQDQSSLLPTVQKKDNVPVSLPGPLTAVLSTPTLTT